MHVFIRCSCVFTAEACKFEASHLKTNERRADTEVIGADADRC